MKRLGTAVALTVALGLLSAAPVEARHRRPRPRTAGRVVIHQHGPLVHIYPRPRVSFAFRNHGGFYLDFHYRDARRLRHRWVRRAVREHWRAERRSDRSRARRHRGHDGYGRGRPRH